MRPAAGAQGDAGVDLISPDTGRIDHDAGTHQELGPGQLVAQGGRRSGYVVCTDAGQDSRAVGRCGSGDADDEPGVVDELPVERGQGAS